MKIKTKRIIRGDNSQPNKKNQNENLFLLFKEKEE